MIRPTWHCTTQYSTSRKVLYRCQLSSSLPAVTMKSMWMGRIRGTRIRGDKDASAQLAQILRVMGANLAHALLIQHRISTLAKVPIPANPTLNISLNPSAAPCCEKMQGLWWLSGEQTRFRTDTLCAAASAFWALSLSLSLIPPLSVTFPHVALALKYADKN